MGRFFFFFLTHDASLELISWWLPLVGRKKKVRKLRKRAGRLSEQVDGRISWVGHFVE